MTSRTALRIVTRATTLVAVAVFGLSLIVGMKGPGGVEFEVGFPAQSGPRATLDRLDYPHCEDPATFVGIPATSLVVTDRNQVREIPFASAWKRNNDATTINNAPVIGSCR